MGLFRTKEEKRKDVEDLREVKDCDLPRVTDTQLILMALEQIMWATDCAEWDEPLMNEIKRRIKK